MANLFEITKLPGPSRPSVECHTLGGTGCQFAAWHQTTSISLNNLYDAPVFENVNRFKNTLVKVSETVEVLSLTSAQDSKTPGSTPGS